MVAATPSDLEVVVVEPSDARFAEIVGLADAVLNQGRYLVREYPLAVESHVLAALQDGKFVGFLRFMVQVIGAAERRTPVLHNGSILTEGYVEAFGVDPGARRLGVGTALQASAIESCRSAGCYQMRSRSPITSTENYALKIAAGYVLHPSEENDSYYFLLKL